MDEGLPGDLTQDPGWQAAWKGAAYTPLMGVAPQVVQRSHPDGLIVLRRVFVTFPVALVLFGVVLLFIQPGSGSEPGSDAQLWGAIIAVVGAGSWFVAQLVARSLDFSSDRALAESFRSRFFVRLAFAELPALLAFAAVFIVPGALWLFPWGCLFTAVGLMNAAPTRRQIERDQERLVEAGSTRSLMVALRSPAQ